MLKKSILFAMVALMALISLGCGGGDRRPTETPEEGEASADRLRYEDDAPQE